MGDRRGMERWRENDKRREVVDAIGEEGEARRRKGRKEAKEMLRGEEEKREKIGWGRNGERRNGREWAIDEERLSGATSVHEITKNFCSILFLHCSLMLKNTVQKI